MSVEFHLIAELWFDHWLAGNDNIFAKHKDVVRKILVLTDGTGANEADQVWHDRRTISGNDDLDFEGGLVNAYGVTLNPARVAALIIKADDDNDDDIIVGNAASNQLQLGFGSASDTWRIAPGGWFVVTRPDSSGWSTAAGSADVLRIAPAGGTQTYEIRTIMKSA